VIRQEHPKEGDRSASDESARLPEEVRLALTDIAGAAREGLLAVSVATGLAVMQAMFEAEITAIAGPKGKHNPERTAVRHGAGRGSVTLGGRRLPVSRPRAHTVHGTRFRCSPTPTSPPTTCCRRW
jgi:putative transposase